MARKLTQRTSIAAVKEALPAKPAPVPTWGICASCGRERRIELGVITAHNTWRTWEQVMVPCAGGGLEPETVTE